MYMHFCDLDFQDDVLEFDVFARTKDAKMLPYDQVRHAQQPHFPLSGSSNRVGARHTDKSMCCTMFLCLLLPLQPGQGQSWLHAGACPLC